jgi:hypothetical protein
MRQNVEMPGAILQCRIMDRVEAGMPLENAVSEVAGRESATHASRRRSRLTVQSQPWAAQREKWPSKP